MRPIAGYCASAVYTLSRIRYHYSLRRDIGSPVSTYMWRHLPDFQAMFERDADDFCNLHGVFPWETEERTGSFKVHHYAGVIFDIPVFDDTLMGE